MTYSKLDPLLRTQAFAEQTVQRANPIARTGTEPVSSRTVEREPTVTASERAKWSKEQIQRARRTILAPVLEDRGYALQAIGNENFRLQDVPGLVVKRHYWVWNETRTPPSRAGDRGKNAADQGEDTRGRATMQGNAIDFFIQIECRSFSEAMEILAEYISP